ncbi:MAG: glycosyltransferase [Pseudomonadota bacterium]
MTWLLAVAPALLLRFLGPGILRRLDRAALWPRAFALGVCAALLLRYGFWRLTETVPAPALSVEFAYAATILAFELFLLVVSSLSLLMLIRTRHREPEANAPLQRGQAESNVDVLIPTFDEDLELVLRALVCARAMRHGAVRVHVLDDGNREEVRQLCAEQGVGYLAREHNEFGKAGNLNHALCEITGLTPAPDYVAVFDVDFVPRPEFLERTLPLFNEDDVGLVQTPQYYYNDEAVPYNLRASRGNWPDEQRYLYETVLPSRDAWGQAMCCGTAWIARMAALEAIDGIPTESVTEDKLTSLWLDEAGWRTVYLREVLSAGMGAPGIEEFIAQRTRWCLGTMQIARGPSGPFTSRPVGLVRRLLLMQNVGSWMSIGLLSLILFLSPLVYWYTGLFHLETTLPSFLAYGLPPLAAWIVVNGWLSGKPTSAIRTGVYRRLLLFDLWPAILSGLFGRARYRFVVTAKHTIRPATVVLWRRIVPFLLVIAANLVGFGLALVPSIGPELTPGTTALVTFIAILQVAGLLLTTIVCVERPRPRGEERVSLRETATLHSIDDVYPVQLRNISVSGARVKCDPDLVDRTPLRLDVPTIGPIDCSVTRETSDGLAVRFDSLPEQREALIRLVYGQLPQTAAASTPRMSAPTLLLRRAREILVEAVTSLRAPAAKPRQAPQTADESS